MATFKEMLHASFKSKDTEEWLDVYFTRPIGLVFAIFWNKLGVHPNVITILSIFLGVGAGIMFGYTDLMHNILGVLLLMFANFCDSTDGASHGKEDAVGQGARRLLWRLVVCNHLFCYNLPSFQSEHTWHRIALASAHFRACLRGWRDVPLATELAC